MTLKTALKRRSKESKTFSQKDKEKLRKKCVQLAKDISKARDGYKCCYCHRGKPQVAIHSHHIYNEGCHPSMSADIDNLITVCFTHHNSDWNAHQPSFHKNPMEMADWFKENYTDRYFGLKDKSRRPIQCDYLYWKKKKILLEAELAELSTDERL